MPDRETTAPQTRAEAALEHIERVLTSYEARLVFSLLIVLSLLPASVARRFAPGVSGTALDLLFFAVFFPELVLRVAVLRWRRRQGRAGGAEAIVLLFDLLAVLSFLPLHNLLPDVRYLRLVRLSRLTLLLGYWGGMVRDLFDVASGQERRSQVLFILLFGLLLSFAGAVVVREVAPSWDYNGNGVIEPHDRSFSRILWWSFRQVQDPGNLAVEPSNTVVVAVSLLLTTAGLVLFSFLVGIGTNAIQELMVRAGHRPVGLSHHTVVLGIGDYTYLFLEELAGIYRKNLRRMRAAVLRPHNLDERLASERVAGFRYRTGDPFRAHELDRIDIARAKRVLVLPTSADASDESVLAAVLATRERNPHTMVYPVLEHEKSFTATRIAGGHNTQLIGSGTFLGRYVVQNVINPGILGLCRTLLTTEGCEIYTYLFTGEERQALGAHGPIDPRGLHELAATRHDVTLIGIFARRADGSEPTELPILNPAASDWRTAEPRVYDSQGRVRPGEIAGLIGICLRWEHIRRLARDFLREPADARATAAAPGFERLDLALGGCPPRRILVSGSSPRLPRIARELIEFYGHLDVSVAVPDAARVGPLAEHLQAGLDGHLSDSDPCWPSRLTASADASLLTVEGPAGTSRIHLQHDRLDDITRTLRRRASELGTLDAVLFLPGESGQADADGSVALDLLRVLDLHASQPDRFAPDFRALALLRDPVKSRLLESRVRRLVGDADAWRYSIVSAERATQHFITQNVFVRRLSEVFLELLGVRRQHLCRLVVRGTPAGPTFLPGDLARHLLHERELVLVGLELEGRPEPLLEPELLHGRDPIGWSQVKALHAIGAGRAWIGRDAVRP